MKKFVKKQDLLAPTLAQKLHLGDEVQNTECGGFLSLVAKLVFAIIFLIQLDRLLTSGKPYISQSESKFVKNPQENPFEVNKFYYKIVDPYEKEYSFEEIQSHVELTLVQNGESTKMRACDKDKIINNQSPQNSICFDTDALKLSDQDKSFEIQVKRAENSDEGQEWLSNKVLVPYVVSSLPDFNNKETDTPYFQITKVLDSISLSGKKFTFVEESFKFNSFRINNKWWPTTPKVVGFWSHNHHFKREHDVSEKDLQNLPLAKIKWTIDDLQNDIQMEVFQIHDFLGLIGGLFEVLLFIIWLVFGNYLDFVGKLKWIKLLYKFKVPDSLDTFTNEQKLDLSNINFPFAYFKIFWCRLCKSRKDKVFENLLERGFKQLETDFDYKNLLREDLVLEVDVSNVEITKVLNQNDLQIEDNDIKPVEDSNLNDTKSQSVQESQTNLQPTLKRMSSRNYTPYDVEMGSTITSGVGQICREAKEPKVQVSSGIAQIYRKPPNQLPPLPTKSLSSAQVNKVKNKFDQN